MSNNILNNTSIENNSTHFHLQVENIQQINLRLDKFLALKLPFSRTLLQKWLEQGYIRVNDNLQTAKYKTKLGDLINVQAAALPQDLAFTPENIPLDIVYDDEHILIINKPVGLVVHPAPSNWQGTLLNALLYHYPQTQYLPRAGIVHRIDKMTSGIMVITKTLQAQTAIVEAMQQRLIKRQYLAIVQGLINISGTINAPIGRHPTYKTKMAIVEGGKPSITHYQRIASLPLQNYTNQSHSLVHCTLETGRTHQIRVHMASIKHSLLGDAVYSKDNISQFAASQRQALHAVSLSLQHPISGQNLHFCIKPQDTLMQDALQEYQNILPQDLYTRFKI